MPSAHATSCATASQLTATQRDALSNTARTMVGEVQSGDVQGLRTSTIPAVAADFNGIANSAETLKPLLQNATITVDNLFTFDTGTDQAGAQGIQFYCSPAHSNMTVVLNFPTIPSGKYAAVILHATGVPQPQQISLVLSQSQPNQWKLAGFFNKPMLTAGHDGLWYWSQARQYSQKKMNWDAWFYYLNAAFLLDPVDFISSPNLEKLRRETDQVHPDNLPGVKSMMLDASGSSFEVTGLETTDSLGGLDLVVYYNPSAIQAGGLRDPVTARKQVVDLMKAMLAVHPELGSAFHGIWIHANQNGASVFALELPMDQIAGANPGTT
ncbi:hypothetical protein H7849_04265 [Alloacidobacterium dinghuense]|uniref:Uncharacterized protein n=1 Tax=Alloacidobacterium dinghuense TaxID=2763107 RepID=A0A7G8BKX2_9BACT|nr:hypothetical protein [Alloacidobacterium dinghuense]QNI33192.1 hypothetical protein H7849_04265 [Alloacidobacterium dinghuense]